MPTRHYFGPRKPPKKYPCKPRKPKPKPVVIGKAETATGTIAVQAMTAGQARHHQGVRKGGLVIWETGVAHKWTSEQARAAAQKRWRVKGRKRRRYGPNADQPMIRLGYKLATAPRQDRKALRVLGAAMPRKGIRYSFVDSEWQRYEYVKGICFVRKIGENQALRRLGHLLPARPSSRVFVPEWTTPAPLLPHLRS